ncbi:MAG: Spx/MgsR family RNA polymerase-binding regulatory protein [Rhabdochlamydiaceae bacterium]|nr:Spx/MgsR family RNA polymerase-binding regulatory protein [Rhabdochlamydiaceae bacterium]
MILYIYSKCSTCQKAMQFLKNCAVDIMVKEIIQEPPTVSELQQMLKFQNGDLKKLLNTSGLLYRQMQLSHKMKDMTLEEVFALLSQHGMLVKRPFLIADDFGLTGFNEAKWATSLSVD